MEINIFTIWFLISPFIILHLHFKNKDYKEKANIIVEQINDVWDKDYKDLVKKYGNVSNFIDFHREDFDIIRSNVANIYSSISSINRDYMVMTEKLLEKIKNNSYTKKEIYKAIEDIRRSICIKTDEELININAFLVCEERAHNNNEFILDILEDIDEKYKNNNIYHEVNK